MNKEILIFSGNSETDALVIELANNGFHTVVSVAGETGAEALREKLTSLDKNAAIPEIKTGRMDRDEIRDYIKDKAFEFVIDGTHPFAEEVTANIRSAAEETGTKLIRLDREYSDADISDKNISFFQNYSEAAEYLKDTEGNIFLATGAKEAGKFTDIIDKKRLYLRVLPVAESIEKAKQCGLENTHIIAMQGVFSKELNESLFREFNIKFLVTKDSGRSGGYEEKIAAAGELGIKTCVIRRPGESDGLTRNEVISRLEEAYGRNINAGKTDIRIVLAGVGMGDDQSMTVSALELINDADAIIASSSRIMPDSAAKIKINEYDPVKIAERVQEIIKEKNSGYGKFTIAVLFSGDTGFYSGARKTAEELDKRGISYRILPGISSLSMLSALSGIRWQDAYILSAHGRQADIVSAVKEHEKTFVLLNDASELRQIANEILNAGLFFVKITAGINMGSEREKLLSFEISEAGGINEEGICCCFIENRGTLSRRIITPGLKDEAFVRRDVPMTKEEVRVISICKLKLKSDSVLWDIGSGTGSISVEAARLSSDIKVYAFERNEDAADLTQENALKAGTGNISVICGEAPGTFEGVEAPDAVFIGGSGGKLKDIIKFIMHFEKHIQIVLNCVTIDTIGEINAILKSIPHEGEEIVEVQMARSVKAGDHRILKSLNPVFIVSFIINSSGG